MRAPCHSPKSTVGQDSAMKFVLAMLGLVLFIALLFLSAAAQGKTDDT
jgi:hypothetical protein